MAEKGQQTSILTSFFSPAAGRFKITWITRALSRRHVGNSFRAFFSLGCIDLNLTHLSRRQLGNLRYLAALAIASSKPLGFFNFTEFLSLISKIHSPKDANTQKFGKKSGLLFLSSARVLLCLCHFRCLVCSVVDFRNLTVQAINSLGKGNLLEPCYLLHEHYPSICHWSFETNQKELISGSGGAPLPTQAAVAKLYFLTCQSQPLEAPELAEGSGRKGKENGKCFGVRYT